MAQVALEGQVDIRSGSVVALGAGAVEHRLFDARKAAEHLADGFDDLRGEGRFPRASCVRFRPVGKHALQRLEQRVMLLPDVEQDRFGGFFVVGVRGAVAVGQHLHPALSVGDQAGAECHRGWCRADRRFLRCPAR